MAAFLERLLARGARENWPVLVVLTHWSRQLRHWTDAAGRQHGPSHVALVLDHARNGDPMQPGQFAGEGGGSLPEVSFVRIELGDPVENLDVALRDRFPGLREEDVSAIADKAGGNPRKLEQIMAKIQLKPRWFEGGNLANSFSEAGREAALALSDLPIEEVVLDRFRDTPDEVRRSMIIASLMGKRFLVDLVERLAQARRFVDARRALEEGEQTYRFLRDVVDRSRNDIGAFNERLFFDAARVYRESGLAKSDCPDWPEDGELMRALDDLLLNLVANPDGFDLKTDDLAEALSLAGTRMEATGAPQAGLALARLVAIENRRGNPEGGYAAALRFIKGFTS